MGDGMAKSVFCLGYGPDVLRIMVRFAARTRLFISSPKRSDRLWGPISVLLIAKAAGASSCLPVPFSVEAKNEFRYTLLPHMPSWLAQGRFYRIFERSI